MNKKKVIGLVSKEDPFHDKVAYSGTIYKLREAIEMAGFEVKWIPYNAHIANKLLYYLIIAYQRFFHKKICLTSFYYRPFAKMWAREIDKCPEVKKCDYLCYPLCAPIALYTKNGKPYINISGYTVPDMFDYYFYNFPQKAKDMAIELDSKAALKALVNIRSSNWANDGLINYYHCDSNKCYSLEYGANIDTKDIRKAQAYNGGQIKIFFSGVKWQRKGGKIAVETVEILRSKGIDAQLIVAGPKECPEICKGKDYIDFVGYLNKNNANDYDKYLSLYENSHIMILPTKAECGAIVYSEAAGAGMPCYTYLTGGTGDYVVNGVNGYALPAGSPASAFAEQILSDIKNNRLPSLHEGALKLFHERLSWEAWAKRFSKIMQETTA